MYYRLLSNGNVQSNTGLVFWTDAGIWNRVRPLLIDGVVLHSGSLLTLAPGSGPRLYATLTSPDEIPDLTSTRWDAVAQANDGELLRLAGGRLFHGASAYTKAWQEIPVQDGLAIIDIAVLPGGPVLCLTGDGRFWTLSPDYTTWTREDIPIFLLARIETLPDGSILGVSGAGGLEEAGDLYLLPPDRGHWYPVDGTVKLSNVIALPGGALLGVTAAKKPNDPPGLLDRKPLISHTTPGPWLTTDKPTSGCATLTCGIQPGLLHAIGRDGNLYDAFQAPGGRLKWGPSGLPALPGAVSLAGSPGTRQVFAVGGDSRVYSYTTGANAWTRLTDKTGFAAVTVTDARGTLIAAGTPRADQTAKRLRYARDMWEELAPGPAAGSLGTAHDGAVLETLPDGTVRRWNPGTAAAPAPTGFSGTAQLGYARDVDDSPARWLLPFSSDDNRSVIGDGRPWGDGTAMAARAGYGGAPWDEGNHITPFIGGGETLAAIRDCFESVIAEAEISAAPPGARGHVYIADWLLNGLRDLSEDNPWGVKAWKDPDGDHDVRKDYNFNVPRDQTALGLIGRLMAAGVKVRVLLWMPTSVQGYMTGPQMAQHAALAAAIEELNTTLCAQKGWAGAGPIGVCALDLRTAPSVSSSLHQKLVVIRSGSVHVAFCGGVDLAFTRRDARRPVNAMAGAGDWQSGSTIPIPGAFWPRAVKPAGGRNVTFPFAGDEAKRFPDELDETFYGQPRHWHDQHLKLEGPVVRTLEEQFDERWRMPGSAYLYDNKTGLAFWKNYKGDGTVLFSNAGVVPGVATGPIAPLELGDVPPPCGEALAQMWRTIPIGANRGKGLFSRGEFTVMAGVANAVAKATRLITIWDQYFWSEPLARLLAARLNAVPELRLIIVLPAYGSNDPSAEMGYRRRAMETLWKKAPKAHDRVLVLNAWHHQKNTGIYVHAKVQTYDDCLLVCGSANMNRRSFTNDVELDVAVLHRPTVRWHLERLAHMVLGTPWTGGFGDGWQDTLFAAVKNAARPTRTPGLWLIPDPYYTDTERAQMPNGQPYKPDSTRLTEAAFEPTSLPSGLESTAPGTVGFNDPADATGRLDLLVHLIEFCTKGTAFPYRQ